jgi:16S rRNA (cytosine1402-N4)-methyltransferase
MTCVPAAHTPVMLAEVIAALALRDGGVYIDATFGAGGYAAAMLDTVACRVLGIDRDPEACQRGEAILARYKGRLCLLQGRFGDLTEIAARCGLRNVNGIAFDLGISSLQLEAPERGFSFRMTGPLDMRMDTAHGTTAADAVNRLPQQELADILYTFGEERASRRIAAAIVRARAQEPILDTLKLARIVRSVLPRSADGLDPATRTFQALRIWVNDELAELDLGLMAAERLLAPGGRLVVVAFHSLEDRKVKNFLRLRSGEAPGASRHRPKIAGSKSEPSFRLLNKRAVRPSPREIAKNPRARSARMRAAERTEAPVWTPPTERRSAA